MSQGELRGRKKVADYLIHRYLKFATAVRYEIHPHGGQSQDGTVGGPPFAPGGVDRR